MSIKSEYKINDHLTLRLLEDLERDQTIIYVDGEEFAQCHFLLLIEDLYREGKIELLEAVDSIDEAEDILSNKHERNPNLITSEEEFVAHCSNLQVWVENNYDTRILHRNIAFPLLKKLAEVGDVQTKKVFKEEIARRLASGFESVVLYLLIEGYIEYLSLPELQALTYDLKPKEANIIQRCVIKVLGTPGTNHLLKEHLFNFLDLLNEDIAKKMEFVEYNGEKFFINNKILNIHLTKDEKKKIEKISDIEGLDKLTNLRELQIYNQKINKIEIPENLKSLEVLSLRGNRIEDIADIFKLVNLKMLNLEFNKIEKLKGIENIAKLRKLNLNNNKIKEITSLTNLTNTQSLILYSNNIREIPNLEKLKKLEYLNLNFNPIKKVSNLKFLKKIKKFYR